MVRSFGHPLGPGSMNAPPISNSLLELIGATPMTRLSRVVPQGAGGVFLKLEHLSPNGTAHDRFAQVLLDRAVLDGRLLAGARVVVASSGNTGIALAMLCALRGHPLTVVLLEHLSLERRQLLEAYGAKVVLSPVEEGLSGARTRARQLSAGTGAVHLDQFESPELVELCERTVGSELLRSALEDGGRIDAFVMGLGTGATFTGVGRALRARFPSVRLIAVEPAESSVLRGGKPAAHPVAGIGVDFIPPLLDRKLVDEVIAVESRAAFAMRDRLALQEGLLVGPSTGANVVAAVKIALRLGPDARVYSLACDTGERYFSVAGQVAA